VGEEGSGIDRGRFKSSRVQEFKGEGLRGPREVDIVTRKALKPDMGKTILQELVRV